MVEEKKYYYSEIFHSIQGEGEYTGTPTAWIDSFCAIYNVMVSDKRIQQIQAPMNCLFKTLT